MRGPTRCLRISVVLVTGCAVLLPLGIILYQSFLDAPFFQTSAKLSFSAFQFVLADRDFHRAFATTAVIALGMAAIAVPVGSLLAFLLLPTDGQVGDSLQRRAGLLPGLRGVRPGADSRGSGRAARPVDLPVQADQSARGSVLPADGGGGSGDRGDRVSAGLPAAATSEGI